MPEFLFSHEKSREIFQKHSMWPSFVGSKIDPWTESHGLLPVLLWTEQSMFLTEQRNVLAITKISPYAIENRTEASSSSSSKKDASSSSIKKEGTRSMPDQKLDANWQPEAAVTMNDSENTRLDSKKPDNRQQPKGNNKDKNNKNNKQNNKGKGKDQNSSGDKGPRKRKFDEVEESASAVTTAGNASSSSSSSSFSVAKFFRNVLGARTIAYAYSFFLPPIPADESADACDPPNQILLGSKMNMNHTRSNYMIYAFLKVPNCAGFAYTAK
jgi:hypothetical protein